MSDRILVNAIGVVVEIDLSGRDDSFVDRVRDAWADALHAGDHGADTVVSARPSIDDDAALALLSTDVTLAALAQRRGDELWMLHAAGLADAEGRVVVLCAPSGTGKTTAARHLSRRYAYVSDETVSVARDGSVVPYRKPLSVIESTTAHKTQVAPSRLHAPHALLDALRVARIVVLDRAADGPESPQVEPLELETALALLAPQTSYLSDTASPLHLIRDVLAATGGAVRLRYREVDTIDEAIDALITAPTMPGATGTDSADASFSLGSPPDQVPTTGVVRAAFVDALEVEDGRLAVLTRAESGSTVRILDGIGPAVWAAASGRTIDEITAEVVAVHGRPGDADPAEIVSAAVEQLVIDGLLRRGDSQT